MTQLAYILAASHSGSTLLAMLLGAHPQICTVGELKLTSLGDVNRYRCSCGAWIRECKFWQEISRIMVRRGLPFDIGRAETDYRSGESVFVDRLLRPLHRGLIVETVRDAALWLCPTWRRRLPVLQARNAALISAVRELTQAHLVVDSSKIGLRLKYLLRNRELDVRVVRLIRDGRAVAATYMNPAEYADSKDPQWRGGGMGGDRAAERLSVSRAAREWRRSNEEAEEILACMDRSRWIEIRYEELCRDTKATLSRVFAFLGLDPANLVLDFRSVPHHVVGNGMRFDSTAAIRLDERWREHLTPSHLALFDETAGELNRRYGYA